MRISTGIVILFLLQMPMTLSAYGQRGRGGPGYRGGAGQNAQAQRGRGHGAESQQRDRAGHGPGGDARHAEDHEVLQFLLANHQAIERTVTELPDGVETLTESADPKIAAKIQEHVHWMEKRIKDASPIRMRDPLFREIFRHTEKIHMEHQLTERGVKVRETSTDPYVAKLIQAHAEVVSGFVKRGFAEAMKNHAVPDQVASPTPTALQENPAIAPYGPIAHLPDAVQQPRPGSKLLVDLTGGGDPDKLLKSIEKVARYVNIYKGAGSEAQQVDITVVIHGDATLAVLNDDAYAKKFGLEGNPNLDCLHKLHDAGVELLVCGQSLISKGGQPQEVVVFIDTAVSALTALVNLQSDGYAYVPLAGK